MTESILAEVRCLQVENIITVTVHGARAKFTGESNKLLVLQNEVKRLFKFIVVLPADSATEERSFSTLQRRSKTYLHATISLENFDDNAVWCALCAKVP